VSRSRSRLRHVPPVALAAAAWAALFALTSFAWAAGATTGLSTLGTEIERQAREADTAFVALVWVTGVLKLAAAAIALSLDRLPRRVLTAIAVAAWVLLVYESAELIQHVLMLAGPVDTPEALGDAGVEGHVVLWDPFWILGAALFIGAVRKSRRARSSCACNN